MSVDLRMLPFDADEGHLSFSHTILDCWRRGELWDEITKLPALPTPDSFTSFSGYTSEGETGYAVTTTTPYGDHLTYTTVEKLLTLRDHEGVRDNYKNRAIWAYFAELPKQTKVALYWH